MLSLSVKRTVPAFTGAEADAAACFSHGRRFSLLPPHLPSLPLEGFAVLNDRPMACQIRGPTRRETGAPNIPAALAATYPLRCFAPRRELLLSAVTKVAKSTGRNYVSALPQRATVGCDFPRILADIAFHHRCRIKGLRVRSPARRLPRPLAPATVGVFLSYRRTPQAFPSSGVPPQAFPLGGPRC